MPNDSQETLTSDHDSALIMFIDDVVEGPKPTLETGLELAGTLAGRALREGLSAEATATGSSKP
jgi:hypothetical protein